MTLFVVYVVNVSVLGEAIILGYYHYHHTIPTLPPRYGTIPYQWWWYHTTLPKHNNVGALHHLSCYRIDM